jgi:hypothetical protein
MRLNPYDALIARAAHQLRPGYMTEQEWQRHNHADLPGLQDWEIRRELRVITDYLDTEPGQRDWLRPWFVERRQRLLEELRRRRRNAVQTDEQRVEHRVAKPERPAAPAPTPAPAARADAGISLPWRGGRS